MKKRKSNFTISNRVLYTLITLGILSLFAVGVYAYGSGSPTTSGHSGDEINVDNTFCSRITGHSCGYDVNTDTDTNTWPPAATALYKVNDYCSTAIAGDVRTTRLDCSSRVCNTVGGINYYYQCGGSCALEYYNKKPWSCGSTFIGYLVTGY
jgi:hypothetical protein